MPASIELTICTHHGTLTMGVIKMIKTVSVRKLRADLAHILKDVTGHFDRYIISRRGEPEAVLMCVDDYEGWLETLEIMSDKKVMADIKEAEREIAKGEYYTLDEVIARNKKKAKR